MRRYIWLSVVFFLVLGMGSIRHVQAIPFLQLDIDGGVYDTITETMMTGNPQFILNTLVWDKKYQSGYNYYLTMAVLSDGGSGNFGTITITTGNLTSTYNQYGPNLLYGSPLPSHGIFPAAYFLIPVQVDTSGKYPGYDVADPDSGSGFVYKNSFAINAGSLNDGYELHFDLFATNTNTGGKNKAMTEEVVGKAPFSHDAGYKESVPEPYPLFLLGIGLLAVCTLKRK